MARPKKQAEELRPHVRSYRFSAAEHAEIEARERAAGLAPSEYGRQTLLAGRVVVRQQARADPALIVQLVRIGTNLNQIARTCNTHGGVPDNLDQLCRMVREVVMRAVGEEE